MDRRYSSYCLGQNICYESTSDSIGAVSVKGLPVALKTKWVL